MYQRQQNDIDNKENVKWKSSAKEEEKATAAEAAALGRKGKEITVAKAGLIHVWAATASGIIFLALLNIYVCFNLNPNWFIRTR